MKKKQLNFIQIRYVSTNIKYDREKLTGNKEQQIKKLDIKNGTF